MGVEAEAENRGSDGEESKKRISILVRCLNSNMEIHDEDDDDSGFEFKRFDFHIISLDLNNNTDKQVVEELHLRSDVLPPLLSKTSGGMMFSLSSSSSSFISVFGGLSVSVEASLASLNPPPHRRHLYYKCASMINLHLDHSNSNSKVVDDEWQAFPLQFHKYDADIPVTAALSGKLYNFGLGFDAPEFFDPSLGYWKRIRLPSNFSCYYPSYPVVADPSNNRILIHFRCHSHLYAFYPSDSDSDSDSGGRWERLFPDCDYFPWPETVAVGDDDLIFLYNFDDDLLLLVYDLSSGDKLDVVWSSNKCGDYKVTNTQYTSLFSLGNGFMCFAQFGNQPRPYTTTVVLLLVFTAHRHHGRNNNSTTSIILTPVSYHYKIIESTTKVFDFLPISQETSEILGGKLQ